ncbi:MAG: VOC family protein [Bacteroidales bacterium]
MKLNSLTPNVMVHDVNQTIEWYRTNLGFELVMSVPEEGKSEWAMISRDAVNLMLQTRESIAAEQPEFTDMPIGASQSFFIKVTGLEEIFEKITDTRAVIKPLYKTFYGMNEFIIRDCNGYYLTFAEEDSAKS